MTFLNPLKLFFLPVIATGLPIFALADSTETTKLITEDAYTGDVGKTELEFGYQYASVDNMFDSDGNEIARGDVAGQVFVAKATHGMGQGVDASIEVLWRDVVEDENSELANGIGNVTVSAKWQFYGDGEKGLAFAWVPGFTAPFSGNTASAVLALSQDYWSINNLLVLSFVTGAFNLNMDIGHFLPVGDDRDDQRSEFIGDMAVGWQFTSWLQLEAELNFGHATVSRGSRSVNGAATVGAIMNVSENMRIDVGVQSVEGGRNTEKFTAWILNFSTTF